MVFFKGIKVCFIYIGDIGEVEEWLEYDLIVVWLEDGEVIFVLIEVLECL